MSVRQLDRWDLIAAVFWSAVLIGPGLAAWYSAPRPLQWWFTVETVTIQTMQFPWWIHALGLYAVTLFVLMIITVPLWGPRP